jgi:hypothetical protein
MIDMRKLRKDLKLNNPMLSKERVPSLKKCLRTCLLGRRDMMTSCLATLVLHLSEFLVKSTSWIDVLIIGSFI